MSKERHFIVDMLFVLALFGMFAVSALTLVIIGANSYQMTVNDMNRNSSLRTSVSYLTEKLRQNDNAEFGIQLDTLGDGRCIVLTNVSDTDIFHTYLYLDDGYLKELYVHDSTYIGSDIAGAGSKIVKLSRFDIDLNGQLLHINLETPDGVSQDLYFSSKCD